MRNARAVAMVAFVALGLGLGCRASDVLIDVPRPPKAPETNDPSLFSASENAAFDLSLSSEEEGLMDRAVSPCESFFDFACGGTTPRGASRPPSPFVFSEERKAELRREILEASGARGRSAWAAELAACRQEREAPGNPRERWWKAETARVEKLAPTDARAVLRAAASFEKRGIRVFFSVRPSSTPTPEGRVALEVVPHTLPARGVALAVERAARAVALGEDGLRVMTAAVERVVKALAPPASGDTFFFDGKLLETQNAAYGPAFAELGIRPETPLATRHPEYFLALPQVISGLNAADLRAYFAFRIAELVADWAPATKTEGAWNDACVAGVVDLFADALREPIGKQTETQSALEHQATWFQRTKDALRAAVERGDMGTGRREGWTKAFTTVTALSPRAADATYDGAARRGPFLHQVNRAHSVAHAARVALAGQPMAKRTPPFGLFDLMPFGDAASGRVVHPPASGALIYLQENVPLPVVLGAFGPRLGEAMIAAARGSNAAPRCEPGDGRVAMHAGVLRALLTSMPSWAKTKTTSESDLLTRRRAFLAYAQSYCSEEPDTARTHVNRVVATVPSFQVDYACKSMAAAPATCPPL